MLIYRINSAMRTGIDIVEVTDNYELQSGDFTSLPTGFTPYKVVNNELVASTEEEHAEFETAWFKEHPEDAPKAVKLQPSQSVVQSAMLMKQMVNMQNQQNQINAMLMKQIMELKNNK